jgi:hypothetical protein
MYKPGTRIKPVEEADVYIITAVNGTTITAEDEHGFSYQFQENEVVPVLDNSLFRAALRFDAVQKKEADRTEKPSQPHQKHRPKNYVEVDLHAGVLLGSTAGMSSHQILTEQLEYAREMLDKARRNGDFYVVFVHGKGKGRLRSELQKMLSGMEKLEFFDAEYSRFSSGATEVRLL